MDRLSRLVGSNLVWLIGLVFVLGIASWAMTSIWSLLGTLTGSVILVIIYRIAKKLGYVTTKITVTDIFCFIVLSLFFQILLGMLYRY